MIFSKEVISLFPILTYILRNCFISNSQSVLCLAALFESTFSSKAMMVVNHLIVETMDNAHAKPVRNSSDLISGFPL